MPPISFDQIPNNQRVPFAYIEFNNQRAVSGPGNQPIKALLIGQRIAAGTKQKEALQLVTSYAQAKEYFGAGSELSLMVRAYLLNNQSIACYCMPLDDDGAGVAATGTFTITGTATKAGVAYYYIAGVQVKVSVTVGQTATQHAVALVAAITAITDLPVTAANVAGVVTVTAKNDGKGGNDIDLQVNYNGEEIPAGLAVAIVGMANGDANPDINLAFAALDDTQYNVIVAPYYDATNLGKVETELDSRWGPLTQNDGHYFAAVRAANHAAYITLGAAKNSKHTTLMECHKNPTSPCEKAAALAGVVAGQISIDPARPMQTLELVGVLPPVRTERFTSPERNLLLLDGIATSYVDDGGKVRIERVINTYQTNSLGADDVSYLDYNTNATLSYLRWSLRTRLLLKFPRHKLASNGTKFASGQAIVTPNIIKSEIVALFSEWESAGLVEGLEQFKSDLIVERNVNDKNRIDILMGPDLVNQLRVSATQIQFLI